MTRHYSLKFCNKYKTKIIIKIIIKIHGPEGVRTRCYINIVNVLITYFVTDVCIEWTDIERSMEYNKYISDDNLEGKGLKCTVIRGNKRNENIE